MRSRMRAALVTAFDKPPSFGSFAPPTAGPSAVLIRVTAAAVTPIVRVAASGNLGNANAQRPFIPGMDGVGHLVDNPSSRVYFSFPAAPYGSLAETVAMPRSQVIVIPDDLSDIEAAALANPALAGWMALTRRARLMAGETVLINGATGSAGRLAIQIARHLGASRVIATGRNLQRLEETRALGADELIALDGSREEMIGRFKKAVQGGVDVVLDYLWGATAEQLATALINSGSRTERSRRIRWVNLGAPSGPTAALPAIALRTANLELLGSGLGTEPDTEILAGLGEAFKVAREAGFKVDTWTAKIEDVEKAWTTAEKDKRLIITM